MCASLFCQTAPATPTLQSLVSELASVEDWHLLGVNLGLQGHQLRVIERTYRGETNRCKSEVLDFWLRNNENPTWEAIIEALDKMQQQKVHHEIRKKYCSSSTATGKYQSRII